MLFEAELETLERPELEKLQSRRLQRLVRRVFEDVPFYRQRLREGGIDPSHFPGIRALADLPFTFKEDFRTQYPFGLLAVPQSELARVHASSGTTGQPIITGYSRSDLEVFARVNARSLAAGGGEPGMLLHNAYGYGLFTGGLGIHGGGEALGLTVTPVSGGMTERQVRLIQDLKPDIITCTPSYAQTLADEFARRSVTTSEISLRFALLGAEPWTDTIRIAVDQGLGVLSTNIYGLTEIIGPGVSQECWQERSGSHIWEDHFLPEIVDPESREPVQAGESGVLVLTTLTRQAQPVLRYWTGDITRLDYAPCSCGRTHVRMGTIQGRTDDLVILRGVNLYPTQIEEILRLETALSAHYQIILSRPHTLDELELKVELSESFAAEIEACDDGQGRLRPSPQLALVQKHIGKRIRDSLGVRVAVTLQPCSSLPRSEGGKLRRIIDQRT